MVCDEQETLDNAGYNVFRVAMGGYTVLEANMGDTDRGSLGFEWSEGHTQVGRQGHSRQVWSEGSHSMW